MRVSQVTAKVLMDYIRLDEPTDEDMKLLTAILDSAKAYVSSYTGLPLTATQEEKNCIEDHEDITTAVLVLCQDMYDNRSMYVEKSYVNKTVDTILNMHCCNFV